MSIHIINPHPSLSLLRKRQLLPYIQGRSVPKTYQEAIQNTVASFSEAKRTLDWFFDVAGFQSSATDDEGIPSLADRKNLYIFEDDDTFPPHLKTIPWADRTATTQIFDFKRLYDTIILMFHAYWLDFNGIEHLGPAGAETMKMLEDRNRTLHHEASTGWFHAQNMFTSPNVGLRDDWSSDAVFAQQWFTGPNPTTIELASSEWMQTFTRAAQSNAAVLNLFKTAPPKSFYVQDYSYFRQAAGLKPTEQITSTPSDDGVPQFGCASVALFYLPPSGEIHPVAIIIDWKGSLEASVTVFNKRTLPTDPTDGEAGDWPWRYAKMCVQVADWTRHELTVHLTDTHFIEEVTLVAAQRTFPTDHPVYQLIKDHWTTTLSINALARSVLVPKVVMPLSPFTQAQIIQFVNYEYANFDWTGKYIPTDLERRGFPVAELDTNPKYHNYGYGRDIHLVWNTLRKFAASVLTQHYKGGDADVRSDSWVAAFCAEMQSSFGGKMAQFPTVTTLDGLIDMVTMCIHIASPQHTAVNYLQQYYMTFVPNKPASLYAPLPTTLAALSAFGEAEVLDSLPIKKGQDQDWLLAAQVPYLLSPDVEEAVNLTTFAKQAAADHDPVMAAAGRALQTDLVALTAALKKVSAQLDDQVKEYDVLYPDQTAKAIII